MQSVPSPSHLKSERYEDAQHANEIIGTIAQMSKSIKIIKSMTAEETLLNHYLEIKGYDVTETDLGGWSPDGAYILGAIGLILIYFFQGRDQARNLIQNGINCGACKRHLPHIFFQEHGFRQLPAVAAQPFRDRRPSIRPVVSRQKNTTLRSLVDVARTLTIRNSWRHRFLNPVARWRPTIHRVTCVGGWG